MSLKNLGLNLDYSIRLTKSYLHPKLPFVAKSCRYHQSAETARHSPKSVIQHILKISDRHSVLAYFRYSNT